MTALARQDLGFAIDDGAFGAMKCVMYWGARH